MGVKVRPLADRVLLQPVADEGETMSGGIIIPDSAKEKPQEGKVVATGPGKTLDNGDVREVSVKVGEMVIYSKYSGTEIKFDGNEYLLVREDDILGIIG